VEGGLVSGCLPVADGGAIVYEGCFGRAKHELRGFEGRYELRPGSILDLTARGGSLYANEWELVPLGGERFFSIQDFSPVRFVRDEAGAVVRMDWGAEDDPYPIPRLGDLEG
jgi:hypothetical protein